MKIGVAAFILVASVAMFWFQGSVMGAHAFTWWSVGLMQAAALSRGLDALLDRLMRRG